MPPVQISEATQKVETTTTTTSTSTREVPHGPTAPPLKNAQTRIILSWPNEPNFIDLYVRGCKHGGGPVSCLVYYGDKCGCSSACQDVDNTSGGMQIVNIKLPRTFHGNAKEKWAFQRSLPYKEAFKFTQNLTSF